MAFKKALKKELYVALHAQTTRFRAVKYAILIPLFASIYWWRGGEVLAWALGISLAFAIALHLFYRSKTNGWEDSWGGYKSLFKE